MTRQYPETVRTAAYLQTQERMDLRGFKATRTGKTRRGKINCVPPNKQCGNRCIPPNWDCRLKGEGTNSELNVHKSDPLAGIASIQRGVVNLRRGVTTLNPAQIQRGRAAVIRGAVKLAPGDNLEQKKRLRKNLTEKTAPVAAVLGVTVLGLATHAALKRSFSEYRNGWGADVDRAAARGVDSFLDRAPYFGPRRAATRAAGAAAVQAFATAGLRDNRIQRTQAVTQGNTRGIGPLSFRPEVANTEGSHLRDQLGAINRETRERGRSFEDWKQSSVETLYSAQSKGTRPGQNARGSIFSEHAANEFLVSKFGLASGGRTTGYVGGGSEVTMHARNQHVEGLLADRLSSWGDDMRADMRLRRITGANGEISTDDINRYIREIGDTQLNTRYAHLTAAQRSAMRTQTHDLMRVAIGGDPSSVRRQAGEMRQRLVSSYDQYFEDSARYMRRNANASDSPFGDGVVGLARYVSAHRRHRTIAFSTRTSAGPGPRSTRILSRSHADLILRDHYHRYVMEMRTPFSISDNTARRIAQEISRSAELPDADAAFSILQANGFPQVVRTGTRSRGRRDAAEGPRKGKPCGESSIPRNHECRKGTALVSSNPAPSNANLKVAVAVGGALIAGSLITSIGTNQNKVSEYRSHVSDSALKAETLAKTMMDEMRQDASRRLGKDVKDVTGFEASVYNFKDPGHDRGFGSNDKSPAYFGQTPNSRGAVVMLSYADDNRFTRQGQGSYKMVTRGAFQEIWGEHDILPFANSISQPSRRSPDDITLHARDRVVKAAGPLGKGVKGVIFTKEALSNFDYLRDNVNKRGHNPDAIRVAAFVVAQRRLTGKPVNLMSYSNGGNVASETLAILKEMGYRDIKVVNVAGPTFGIFKHNRDQMRTWVSPGDEFWTVGRSAAFQGSNVQMLRNRSIPHGLTAKTDPNNRENGKEWKKNYKEKNSYLLDEQLQQEAHRFLTVDKRRSRELADEFIWRTAEKKGMEGDLDTLIGSNVSSITSGYLKRRKSNPELADNWLRDEIEKSMIDKWYGGFDPKAVKRRQKQIQRDLQEQITGKRSVTEAA